MVPVVSSDGMFKKLYNILSRCYLRFKVDRSLTNDGDSQTGIIVYDELMSYYQRLIYSCGLPLKQIVYGSIKKEDCSFLYHLIIQEKPKVVLQIGTFVGFSTLIIAEALKRNGAGKIYTVDPEIPHREISNPVDIARRGAKERGLDSHIEFVKGWFSCVPYWDDKKIPLEVVGHRLLPHIEPLDFVFIDGEHSTISTMSDFLGCGKFFESKWYRK